MVRRQTKLTEQDHKRAAEILIQVQDLLNQLGNIPGAVNVRQKLRVQKVVQEKLIDPLRESWDEQGYPYIEDPYPGVHYAV